MKSFKNFIVENIPNRPGPLNPYGPGRRDLSPGGDHDGDGIHNLFDPDYPYDVDWNDPANPTDDEVQTPVAPEGFPLGPGPHPNRWPYIPRDPNQPPGPDNPFVRPKGIQDVHPSLRDVNAPPGWPSDVLIPFNVPGPNPAPRPIPTFPEQGQQPGDRVT